MLQVSCLQRVAWLTMSMRVTILCIIGIAPYDQHSKVRPGQARRSTHLAVEKYKRALMCVLCWSVALQHLAVGSPAGAASV